MPARAAHLFHFCRRLSHGCRDGSILRFGTGKRQVFDQVLRAGVDDDELRKAVDAEAGGASTIFTDVRELGARRGIFTLATDWDSSAESFEAYVETVAPGQLSEAGTHVGESKVRRGRHVASGTDCPPEVDTLYESLLRHLREIGDDDAAPITAWP